MIDHTGINVSNLQTSGHFYQAVLAALGYVVKRNLATTLSYGKPCPGLADDPGGEFWLHEGVPFSPRSHVAFRARSTQNVDDFYRIALELGGTSNGAPGLRSHFHPGYYAAFVFDPDGYNVEAVFHGSV